MISETKCKTSKIFLVCPAPARAALPTPVHACDIRKQQGLHELAHQAAGSNPRSDTR